VERAEERMLADWEAACGPIDDRFLEDFPARETNGAARRLEDQAARLGFSLGPRAESRYPDLVEGPSEEFRDAGIGKHLAAVLELREDESIEVPRALASYLEAHRAELDEIVHLLLTTEPRWAFDPERDLLGGRCNLLARILLEKVLLVHALEREGAGDHRSSSRAMEAAWRLNRRLAETPRFLDSLIYLSASRFHMGVLRRLERPDPAWVDRIHQTDPIGALMIGLRGEGRFYHRVATLDPVEMCAELPPSFEVDCEPTWQERVAYNRVTAPLYHAGLLDLFGAVAEFHRTASETRICDLDHSASTEAYEEATALLNPMRVVGSVFVPGLGSVWVRAKHVAVEAEGTSRILALKRALASTSNPPRSQEELDALIEERGLERGSVCEGGAWAYRLEGDPPSYVVRYEGPDLSHGDDPYMLSLEGRIPLAPVR
jgi:hypothetical protein